MLIPKERLILIGVVAAAAAVAAWWGRDSLAPLSLEPKALPVERSAPPGLVPPDLRPQPPKPAAPAGPRPVSLRDGTSRDLAMAPGKLLIVHFWATWCPPCVEELPGLLAYANSIKGDPSVEVLAVSVDPDWKTVDTFLRKMKATGLPVALDPSSATARAFGTEKFPETWFLDPSGRVMEAFIGPADWNRPETRKRLAELREQARKGLPGRAVGQ